MPANLPSPSSAGAPENPSPGDGDSARSPSVPTCATDAFTVLDNYYHSIMGPTNPNRCYMWTGSVGNVDYLGAAGTDGFGSGPITGNGLSPLGHYLAWETFPEVLDKAGVTWKVYQDLAGATFAPAGALSRVTTFSDATIAAP